MTRSIEAVQPRNDYFNVSHGNLAKNEHALKDAVAEVLSYLEGTSTEPEIAVGHWPFSNQF